MFSEFSYVLEVKLFSVFRTLEFVGEIISGRDIHYLHQGCQGCVRCGGVGGVRGV